MPAKSTASGFAPTRLFAESDASRTLSVAVEALPSCVVRVLQPVPQPNPSNTTRLSPQGIRSVHNVYRLVQVDDMVVSLHIRPIVQRDSRLIPRGMAQPQPAPSKTIQASKKRAETTRPGGSRWRRQNRASVDRLSGSDELPSADRGSPLSDYSSDLGQSVNQLRREPGAEPGASHRVHGICRRWEVWCDWGMFAFGAPLQIRCQRTT